MQHFGVKEFFLGKNASKYLGLSRLLSMLYVAVLMAATVLAYKIIRVSSHIDITASTVVFTMSYFVAMMIAELYGPYLARRVIWETLICGYVFAILITIMLKLPSPAFWMNSHAYDSTLGHVLRFTIAGSIGFLLSNFLAVFLLQKWRILLKGKWFSLRSLGATSLGEAIATYSVGVITFYGMMPMHRILWVMTCALGYKLIINSIIAWPVAFFVILIKKLESRRNRLKSKSGNTFYSEPQSPLASANQ